MKRIAIRIVLIILCCVGFAFLFSRVKDNGTGDAPDTEYADPVSSVEATENRSYETEDSPESETAAQTEEETVPPATEGITAPETEGVTVPPIGTPDTTPPFFLNLFDPVTVEVGKKFNLHNHISYLDDVDSDVDLTVEGNVDTSTVGEYRLTLTLKDDAGNSFTDKMTVKVAEPDPNKTVRPPTVPKSFAEFTEKYKTDDTMVGIDVSKWQGEIDFNKVAQAGCEFVIIRIGGYAEGVFSDKYFSNNIKNAKAAGLKVGVYWYSEENGPDAVRKNANYLYGLLGGETLDFPIFFDWEDYINFEDYKMSLRDLNEMFLAFREEAEARGYKAALYNSKYYLGILWSEKVKEGGVWLAHYIDQTTYDGKYFLWQQGFGRIDGIYGDVDVDVFYPDRMP